VKRKISDKQIAALKYMIIQTPAYDVLKRILILLIESSGRMTSDVQITISDVEGFSQTHIRWTVSDFDNMVSLNGNFHLGALVHLTGSKHVFGIQNTSTAEVFAFTFWLAKTPYSEKARQIRVSREILDGVDIRESGLYPNC
jgi:hypothetical protein